MKIANLILIHTNPIQVLRLVNRIQHPQVFNYIHLDRKADKNLFEELNKVSQTRIIDPRINVKWGGYSQVESMVKGIEYILENDHEANFINIMSGQDYPLKSIQELVQLTEENPEKEFMECKSIENNTIHSWRLFNRHYPEVEFHGKYLMLNLINRVFKKANLNNMEIRHGSNWMMITRAAAQYLIEFLKDQKKFTRFFKTVWGCDEYVFHTILYNSSFKDYITHDNLRYIDWSERGPRPKILKVEDYNELLTSNKFIARKFDIRVDPEIMNLLDKSIDIG